MQSFSQRKGLKSVRNSIQRESADEELRNALWNALHIFYWVTLPPWLHQTENDFNLLFKRIWMFHYKNILDEIENSTEKFIKKIKKDFLTLQWNEMFDLLEFIPNNYGNEFTPLNTKFINYTNAILKEHLSAYRFIDGLIVEITSEEEISAIEEAIQDSSKFKAVQTHLRTALQYLADRKSPDYRNSIKESISSIESFACSITNKPKASLAQSLAELEKKHKLHSALKSAFTQLYNYTSDEGGVRHKLLDDSIAPKQEDAKFMLVVCSAFINYLIVKVDEN